ncbi:MAG: HAD family hydrolase [Salinivirgaceae bacterium]|nr:HAD family hydrolase [Salinivirgaceae bacterium]
MNSSINTIIWDWNGTLLNDINICLQAMNLLLTERKLPLLDEKRYKAIFTFPVKEYYQQIGFDFTKEPFEKPALEFIENYHKFLPEAQLFSEVIPTLEKFKSLKKKQMVLSAMEEKSLTQSISHLKISKYFSKIAGITDHFAKSKIERGIKLLADENINSNECVLIGDTIHDKEVAKELGCKCILIANGHQSINRLQIDGNVVLNNLSELINRFQ